MNKNPVVIYWFRRDLRLNDNAALYHALKSGFPVVPLFIFDKKILDALESKTDKRVVFIHKQIKRINAELKESGSTILCKYGVPIVIWQQLMIEFNVKAVFANHDYEPYAIPRDSEVEELLHVNNSSLHTYKDQVIFEKNEVVKNDGSPYTIFTPYSKLWLKTLNAFYLRSYPTQKYFNNFCKEKFDAIPTLSQMGFTTTEAEFPLPIVDDELVKRYDKQRNFPAIDGTSRLGIHLRFGTISIRQLALHVQKLNSTFLNELCWRDFYSMILWHFPHVVKGAFKPKYNQLQWRNDVNEFEKWCIGQTGYPIVDAGMRELNETGFMHNRVRMIVASFLTKHLLIDWRWGEAYFASKLLDFDLASNNGGWQWAAGSGCDSAPYFRIFNPAEQTRKFDPELKYVTKWVPEFQDFSYPPPMVDHKLARERCLVTYKKSLQQ